MKSVRRSGSGRITTVAGTPQISGKRFFIVPESEYEHLRQRAAVAGDVQLPNLPAKLASGNYPAVAALRAGLARKLVQRRWAAGLTQAELARRANIRPETLNRIEKAKVTADTATVTKISRALDKAEHEQIAGVEMMGNSPIVIPAPPR